MTAAVAYRFGDCRIDPLARELHRGDALLSLSPKVFDCLVYLIEHRDRAVGRDELMAAVWGRADVSDTLLGQTVLKARRAVGDGGRAQEAIRTVPRFGYRWVGELAVEAAAHELPGDTPAPQAGTGALPDPAPADTPAGKRAHLAPPRRRGPSVLVALALLLALAAGAWQWQRVHHAPPPAPQAGTPADAIIVLPATVAAGEEWRWLRLGLMDLVANRLRRGGRTVVPSDNVVAAVGAPAAGQPGSDPVAATRAAIGRRPVVGVQVRHAGTAWSVQLDWQDSGGHGEAPIAVHGADPVAAARDATDRLLARLGNTPPVDTAGGAAASLAELEQRTDAALLAGDLAGARVLIAEAPASLREAPPMQLRHAQVELRSGRFAAASVLLAHLLDATPAESAPLLRARALYAGGVVALRQDRSSDAERAFTEAIALTETRDEPGVLGRAYTGLAAAGVNLGRFDAAAAALARARVALEMAGDALALAAVDANEGVLDNARDRPSDALPVLARAAASFQRFGAIDDQALTVAALVKAHLALLDPPAALAASEPLWSRQMDIASGRSRDSLALQRARALAAAGELGEAGRLLEELSARLEPGEAGLPGDTASERARLALARGDAAAAAALARAAVDALPTIDEAPERARAWLTLARALRASGDGDQAAAATREFARWAGSQASQPAVGLFAAVATAEQARASGDASAAQRAFSAALDQAERSAVPRDLVVAAVAWADALLADGEHDQASAVVGRVARWAGQDFDCALLQARLYHALGRRDAWQAALARARSLAGERPLPALPAAT